MKSEFFSAIVTAEISLLFVPMIAPRVTTRIFNMPIEVKKQVYLGAVLFIFLSITAMKIGISFTSFLANVVAISLIYQCYGFLAHSLFRIKPKWIGNILGLIAFSPLVIGLILSTFGILGLMFIVGDFETDFEAKLSNDLRCLVSSTGNATSAGDTEIRVYKSIAWGIEYRVNREFLPHNMSSSTYQNECQKLVTDYKSKL